MNKKEWNEGLDHINYDLVEKYALQKDKLRQKKRLKAVWIRFGAFAACLALIVTAAVTLPGILTDDVHVDTAGNEAATSSPNSGIIDPFFNISDAMGEGEIIHTEYLFYNIITDKYSEYKSGPYRSIKVISEEFVGDKIDEVHVRTGWYRTVDKTEYDVLEVKADVYTVKGLNSNVAIAIKFSEEPSSGTTTDYYVFLNPNCKQASTLLELYEIYNADEYMQVLKYANRLIKNDIVYTYGQYIINADALDAITELLLSFESTAAYFPELQEDMQKINDMIKACRVSVELWVDMRSTTVRAFILDNGYVYFIGFGDSYVFFDVGAESAQRLIDFFFEHAKSEAHSYLGFDETTTVETSIG